MKKGPFKLKSGNEPAFKMMGSSPVKNVDLKSLAFGSQARRDEYDRRGWAYDETTKDTSDWSGTPADPHPSDTTKLKPRTVKLPEPKTKLAPGLEQTIASPKIIVNRDIQTAGKEASKNLTYKKPETTKLKTTRPSTGKRPGASLRLKYKGASKWKQRQMRKNPKYKNYDFSMI